MSVLERIRQSIAALRQELLPRQLGFQTDVELSVVRLGSSYGGWTIVPELIDATSGVLSVGVGTDVSFDLELIERFGCIVHAFDPTPRARRWVDEQSFPVEFKFHPLALASFDGEIELVPPRRNHHVSFHTQSVTKRGREGAVLVPATTLSGLMTRTGLDNVDLLKMDIEGSEYSVIDSFEKFEHLPRQLLIEFHHGMYGFTVSDTKIGVQTLRDLGYRLFDISQTGREFGFLRLSI